MKLEVSFNGLNAMQKKLLKAADPAKIKRVVANNTEQLRQKAWQKAPISTEKTNPHGQHGQLKKSIQSELEEDGRAGVVRATAEYAEYVELGTRFMDEQPFMQPALEEQSPKFIRDLKKAMVPK